MTPTETILIIVFTSAYLLVFLRLLNLYTSNGKTYRIECKNGLESIKMIKTDTGEYCVLKNLKYDSNIDCFICVDLETNMSQEKLLDIFKDYDYSIKLLGVKNKQLR